MAASSHSRAKALFLEALARPEGERAAFLAGACGTDAALLGEVQSLLGWHEPGSFPPASPAVSRRLERRQSTPAASAADTSSGHNLPNEVVLQTCRRVRIVSLAFGCIWAVMTPVNHYLLGGVGDFAYTFRPYYPYPGVPLGVLGVATSLVMALVAARAIDRPRLVMDAGSAYLLVQCLLISILAQWVQIPPVPRISWVCIPILLYPAVVPNSPRKTLWISLAAASMEPLALGGLTLLRGIPVTGGAMYLVWSFLPNYVCALLVVVPVRIIHRLGQQVRRAHELGSYRLEAPLGKGGMGEVFRASHHMLARPAAIKLIRSEALDTSSPAAARVMTERFRREAEATASLRSQHTVDLYDFGVAQDGTFFFVMELLDGLDLETLVRRFGPLTPERAVHLLRQACESLEEAHSRGLIHRDIKPSNIFACRMGLAVDFVKVLDFGLVKTLTDGDGQATMLTAPHSTWGTPGYIAPEVVRGDTVDHRVDLYALGCVGYWMLTGRQVFSAGNAMKLLFEHVNGDPAPPSRYAEVAIPVALDDAILACLAKTPANRPANAGELSRRLAAAVPPDAWTSERAHAWWTRHLPATMPLTSLEARTGA